MSRIYAIAAILSLEEIIQHHTKQFYVYLFRNLHKSVVHI